MISPNWTKAFQPGNCDGQDVLKQDLCRFAHHWIPDTADVTDEESLELINGVEFTLRRNFPYVCVALLALLVISIGLVMGLVSWGCKNEGSEDGRKHKQN